MSVTSILNPTLHLWVVFAGTLLSEATPRHGEKAVYEAARSVMRCLRALDAGKGTYKPSMLQDLVQGVMELDGVLHPGNNYGNDLDGGFL